MRPPAGGDHVEMKAGHTRAAHFSTEARIFFKKLVLTIKLLLFFKLVISSNIYK